MNIPEIESKNGAIYSKFVFFKKGGMGDIYKGMDSSTNEEVILKLISIGGLEEKKLLETEINVCDLLAHPNIAKTLKTGQIEVSGNSFLYIVQQYYSNGNMRSIIKENMPFRDCVALIFDILHGMKEIHKIVVHRDLKPENILVDSNGRLLLADFGLAKYIDEKTRIHSFKGYGTIPYMAPECWTGDKNTVSMDIYALGLIFFEIITGRLPSAANTEAAWRDFHLFTPLPNIASIRPGITIKFNQIIQKMTNKRASERYRSIEEVLSSIEDAARINVVETAEAERLANMGSHVLQNRKEERLKIEQEREKTNERIKILNFQITELFNTVTEKINSINEKMEDGKFRVSEKRLVQGSTKRKLIISFDNKSISFEVAEYDLLERHEVDIRKRFCDYQMRKYGMIMKIPEDSFLRKNKVVLFGLAKTDFKIDTSEYGYNILLRGSDDSSYGEWHIMQFSKNISPPENSFGIDSSVFLLNYDEMKSSMFHATLFRKLEEKDIVTLIERFF